MAFELARAFVELQAKGFRTVTGAIEGVKNQLGGLVSFAGGPVAMGLAALGGAAAAGAGGVAMIKMAADAEQLEIALGTMLGGADKAKQMIAELTDFAAKTPFEMQGIQQSAKTLLAFGTAQDQVLPILQILGDVAAGTGKDLGELTTIFGQISAAGKLTGGDLMQLTNAGVPMLQVLGKQLGKTPGEIKEMVEAGQISSAEVTKAFQSMGQAGGLFNGMMAAQSQSLSGLWSTMKDTIGQGALSIGNALVEGLDLKSIVSNFTTFAEMVSNEWIPSMISGFRWFSENVFTPLQGAIDKVRDAYWNLFGAVREQIGNLTSWIGGLLGNSESGFIGYLVKINKEWGENYASMINFVADFVRDIDLYWEYAYTSIGNSMNNIYQAVSTGMSNGWTITKWFFTNFFDIAGNVLGAIPELFMNYVEQIRNNWTSLLEFFATGELNIDFTPLQRAAAMIFDGIEMPKLESAQYDALQQDLDNISKRMADRQAARQKKNQVQSVDAAKQETGQKANSLKIEENITKEKSKQKSGFVDLAGLADKMQQSVLDSEKKKTEAPKPQSDLKAGVASTASAIGSSIGSGTVVSDLATKFKSIGEGISASVANARSAADSQATSVLNSLLTLAQGQGLKIAMPSGEIKLPATNVQFGKQGE